MQSYHLIVHDTCVQEPRRVDFRADSPDHAFQIPRNEKEGVHVELWESDKLLARMTREEGSLWKLLPSEKPIDQWCG